MAVGSTRGKRRLGRHVKPIRLRSKFSAEEVAERALCSPHTVYRLESGEALPSRTRLAAILAIIGATAAEREKAIQLWSVADVDGSLIEHAEDLPVKYRRFRMDENEAASERTLDMVVVPGLLQTAAYATALSAGAHRLIESDQWQERAGAERAERQALLTREKHPLRYHGLVSEAALKNTVGGAEVMAAQLDHLLSMIELPHVVLQVITFGHGAPGGMSGPMQILAFDDLDGDEQESTAYVESVIGMEPVQKPSAVAKLLSVWKDVASAAPSPQQSAEMIRAERNRL